MTKLTHVDYNLTSVWVYQW